MSSERSMISAEEHAWVRCKGLILRAWSASCSLWPENENKYMQKEAIKKLDNTLVCRGKQDFILRIMRRGEWKDFNQVSKGVAWSNFINLILATQWWVFWRKELEGYLVRSPKVNFYPLSVCKRGITENLQKKNKYKWNILSTIPTQGKRLRVTMA